MYIVHHNEAYGIQIVWEGSKPMCFASFLFRMNNLLWLNYEKIILNYMWFNSILPKKPTTIPCFCRKTALHQIIVISISHVRYTCHFITKIPSKNTCTTRIILGFLDPLLPSFFISQFYLSFNLFFFFLNSILLLHLSSYEILATHPIEMPSLLIPTTIFTNS